MKNPIRAFNKFYK